MVLVYAKIAVDTMMNVVNNAIVTGSSGMVGCGVGDSVTVVFVGSGLGVVVFVGSGVGEGDAVAVASGVGEGEGLGLGVGVAVSVGVGSIVCATTVVNVKNNSSMKVNANVLVIKLSSPIKLFGVGINPYPHS